MKKINTNYNKTKIRLFNKIQPLLEPYGIKKETIVNAIEKSFEEIIRDGSDIHQWLLSLVFLKIFDDKCLLLINPRTPAGNMASFDVLTTAHAMWRVAQWAAVIRGMDDMDASKAMNNVVRVVADRLARGAGAPIRDLRKYMFTCYINELKRIAKKTGIVRHPDWNPNESLSDDGAFVSALENSIFGREILKYLSAKEGNIAVFRYMMGYSCKETAAKMCTSDCAARNTLSRGIRKVFGACLRQLRASGYDEMPKIKVKDRKSGGAKNERPSVSKRRR